MDLPSGSRAIVQDGLDHASQSLFSAADVPLASADELRALVTSPAVRAVLEKRIEQVVKHGHTAESDARLALEKLPQEARSRTLMAIEVLHGEHRNLPVARNRLATAAAQLLAAIDRLDLEIGKDGSAR